MGKWSNLTDAVAAVIRANGNREITGQVLQNALLNIISNLGNFASFAGMATPSTNPGTPDGPVYYFATQAGTYTNFGLLTLDGSCYVLYWDGTAWSSAKMDLPTTAEVTSAVNALIAAETVARQQADATLQSAIAAEATRAAGKEQELDAKINAKTSDITVSQLAESTKQYIEASGGGTITNMPDEEDLTVVNNALQLKDKQAIDAYGKHTIRVKPTTNGITSIDTNKSEWTFRKNVEMNSYVRFPLNSVIDFDGGKINVTGNAAFVGGNEANYRMLRFKGISLCDNLSLIHQNSFSLDEDLGFFNVTKYGVANDSNTDVTSALQNLVDNVARLAWGGTGIKIRKRLIVYFPQGFYRIRRSIVGKLPYITFMGAGRSSVLLWDPEEGQEVMFPTYTYGSNNQIGGNDFENLCFDCDSYEVTRHKYSELPNGWWDGSNAQAYHYASKDTGNNTCIELYGNIRNCQIRGFSAFGINVKKLFSKIYDCEISNCKIGISNRETGTYVQDTLIYNTIVSNTKIGCKFSGYTYFVNGWIDECIENAIYVSSGNYVQLFLTGTHINHTDYAGINCQGSHLYIYGNFTVNRTNCYYAGYVLASIPAGEEDKACAIYSAGNLTANADIKISNAAMADTSDGHASESGKCCVVPIITGHLKQSRISIQGTTNTDKPVVTLNADEPCSIFANRGNWDAALQAYEDDSNKGATTNRPVLPATRAGFRYFDTTLGKPIYWQGTKWVDATGADLV